MCIRMSTACLLACTTGDRSIRASTMDEASRPAMTMGTACVKSMSIPWKGSGRCYGAGFVRIGAYHKSNSRCTSVSSRLCTMSDSEAKRSCMHSLRCWSQKPLDSTMRVNWVETTEFFNTRQCEIFTCILHICTVYLLVGVARPGWSWPLPLRAPSSPLLPSAGREPHSNTYVGHGVTVPHHTGCSVTHGRVEAMEEKSLLSRWG